MHRIVVFGLLALSLNVARADVGARPRQVPFQVTLTVDRDHPEFAFFLVNTEFNKVQRVSPTPTDPVIIKSDDTGSRYFFRDVFVVPKTELIQFDQSLPPAQWFNHEDHFKYGAGSIYVRPILDIFDNREQIEKTYVFQYSGDVFRLELQSENKGNRWVKRAWSVICCGLPSVAIALSGLWIVRRSKRKRRTQQLPPQQ